MILKLGFPVKRVAFLFLLLTIALPVHAQDYTRPTWANLARTLVRFNALNLNDDKIVDDYAAITECELYKAMHDDDFKWNKVRTAIRDSVRQNIATFPVNYAYETQLQLGHYDFSSKEYKLTDKTVIHNVNTFVVYQNEGGACGTAIKNIPSLYRVVLDVPISFEGLPLEEKDAQALLQRMKNNNNPDKVIYTHFNLRVTYIEPLLHAEVKGEDTALQNNAVGNRDARFDAHLDSIDFYEDQSLTQLIYTYRP